jgi:hypothetical protein
VLFGGCAGLPSRAAEADLQAQGQHNMPFDLLQAFFAIPEQGERKPLLCLLSCHVHQPALPSSYVPTLQSQASWAVEQKCCVLVAGAPSRVADADQWQSQLADVSQADTQQAIADLNWDSEDLLLLASPSLGPDALEANEFQRAGLLSELTCGALPPRTGAPP